MKRAKKWLSWAHPTGIESSELFLGVFENEKEARGVADEAWNRVSETLMALQMGLRVTPVPAVDLARQYVETWVLRAEGRAGELPREGVRRSWLVWAYRQHAKSLVHFLGVFDFRTEADSVAETTWLELQETPLKSDIGVGVVAVYTGEQARRFISRWVEEVEGLVHGMESWVAALRERSIEEMERNLPRPSGWREELPTCPECDSESAVPILWGYPTQETLEEYEEAVEQGKPPPFALGGCVVEPDSPKWYCNECGHKWGYLDIA